MDEPPKIDENTKFRFSAHIAPSIEGIPEDCIYRHPLHVDASCTLERCVCMCPDCLLARNEETDSGERRPGKGELRYEDLKKMVIENAASARRIR